MLKKFKCRLCGYKLDVDVPDVSINSNFNYVVNEYPVSSFDVRIKPCPNCNKIGGLEAIFLKDMYDNVINVDKNTIYYILSLQFPWKFKYNSIVYDNGLQFYLSLYLLKEDRVKLSEITSISEMYNFTRKHLYKRIVDVQKFLSKYISIRLEKDFDFCNMLREVSSYKIYYNCQSRLIGLVSGTGKNLYGKLLEKYANRLSDDFNML